MVKNGVDVVQNLFDELINVVYGRALGLYIPKLLSF